MGACKSPRRIAWLSCGTACYKSKKEDDKAPEYASTPPSHPLFRVLTNDAAHQPSLSDGKAADYYKWNPQPIAGSHDTYLGQDMSATHTSTELAESCDAAKAASRCS